MGIEGGTVTCFVSRVMMQAPASESSKATAMRTLSLKGKQYPELSAEFFASALSFNGIIVESAALWVSFPLFILACQWRWPPFDSETSWRSTVLLPRKHQLWSNCLILMYLQVLILNWDWGLNLREVSSQSDSKRTWSGWRPSVNSLHSTSQESKIRSDKEERLVASVFCVI